VEKQNSDEFRHKIIIEPVHGDIGLSKLETELIDTATFQRLKGIKQLAFAHTVYPNARHTRFEHSLGVMHITSRMLESFTRKFSQDDVQKLRLGALLHDIGHYPYSHLMEKIDWDYAKKYFTKRSGTSKEVTSDIPKEYPKHEKLGATVIVKRKDIKEKLGEYNIIAPEEIAALITGQHESLPNFLSATLDTDRLDYLLRDSLNTGLPYGKVDLNYIVNNLELSQNNEVLVRAKAANSIEHMLLGRYFMFNTVYMHKTVFGFEEMVRRIVVMLWKQGKIPHSGEDIEKMAEDDSDEFLRFNDGYLDEKIRVSAENRRDKALATLCKAVLFRKPPKLVYQISALKENNKLDAKTGEKYALLTRRQESLQKELVKEFHVPKEQWFFRDIKGPLFEKLHPLVTLQQARQGQEEEAIRELVKVRKPSGEIVNLVEQERSILHYLSQLTPVLYRIYVVGIDNTKAPQVNKYIDKWLESNR